MKNIKLNGIAASDGISLAKAYILIEPNLSITNENCLNKEDDKALYVDAKLKTVKQLEIIKKIVLDKMGEDKAAIFDAHIGITNDPEIEKDVIQMIEDGKSAEYAIDSIFQKYHDMFASYDDAYFAERASDMIDIKKRYLANAKGVELPNIATINEEVIIVAKDLTPSETAVLNKKYVKGFVTEIGGRTSHAAIMARTMEIPAVLSVKELLSTIKPGDMIGFDGCSGLVEINPENPQQWESKIKDYDAYKLEMAKYANEKTKTLDGVEVLLESNIGNPTDAISTKKYGSEGIGLYRSEFLYMDSQEWPSEETQYEGYKAVLQELEGQLVVIRTLDIGGDKLLPYFTFPQEMNPFLGYRAIRFCLDRKDIFRTQLRALGRASVHGELAIMFPMIATVNEFTQAKQFALEVFDELRNEGIKVSDNVQIGMMVEIPAAAANAKALAKHADFFSIGTNDLIQYTMACDRMSEHVSYLYQPNNPSILNLIKLTIDGAKAHGKWVGMCGEMAGDPLSIPILLGLGLEAFSMSPTSILKARKIINNIKYSEAKQLADSVIELSTAEEVNEQVKSFLEKNGNCNKPK